MDAYNDGFHFSGTKIQKQNSRKKGIVVQLS